MLDKNAPEVHVEFQKDRFTVQQQTINHDSKSTAGAIGHTRKKETVAVWDLTYHEFLVVPKLLKEITYFNNKDQELYVHHDFSKSNTKSTDDAVSRILQYLDSRAVNPFKAGSQPLRNITTKELVHPEIASKIVNLFSTGIQLYDSFKKERFFEKNKTISATISKNNFPDFKTLLKSEKSKLAKTKISTSETQRIVALANERNYSLNELSYDLADKNQLFDSDGFFKKETNKSSLIRELEKVLIHDNEEFVKTDAKTCLIIDLILVMQRISWKGCTDFDDLGKQFCKYVSEKASIENTKRIDFAFDSYSDKSIKSFEHIRRCKFECIQYNDITEKTTLPKQQEKFWGSSYNKTLLQKFLCEYIKKYIFFL